MTITNSDSRDASNNSSGRSLHSNDDRSDVFVVGDFQHNLVVLQNMDNDSEDNDDEDLRLIYDASRRYTNQQVSPNHVVISATELNRESRSFSNRDVEDGTITARDGGIKSSLFRLFMRDDEILEVTREEIQRVRVMHKRFLENSKLSFNYNTLLVIASVIASLGLGSNSTATIIASMLVSPLMGPVIGMAYAATIRDCRMFRIAFFTESMSLLMCILVGAVVSACMVSFEISSEWPTKEMTSRGEWTNFWIGLPIAFFSGLGVAVSVLDDQTSSLVGVAISASLLPPAINAGMLWVTSYFYDRDSIEKHEFWEEGIISLGLTIANIVMIIISSMFMFRLKERLPIRKKIFWTDLGLARKIYRNQAILPTVENTTVKNGGRRMGRRVSLLVQAQFSSFDNGNDAIGQGSRREGTGSRVSQFVQSSHPSSNSSINNRDVSLGSEELAATKNDGSHLSTVLE